MDEILERYHIKFESLTPDERQTLFTWANALQGQQLSIERIKEYFKSMRDSVEQSLINEPEFVWVWFFKVPNRKQILLKARLQNYMLIESFLVSPEKAKEKLEAAVASMAPPVG